MIAGDFELREQVGPKGYFGRVVLEAEPQENGDDFCIEFDARHAGRWQSGANFGIEYVLEHIPKRKLFPNGLRILVTAIEGHEVDTTNSVIALVAANALMNALRETVTLKKRLSLDAIGGLIAFPK